MSAFIDSYTYMVQMAYNKMYSDMLCIYSLKIGDKVRYKNFTNITGTITGEDKDMQSWIVNNALLAKDSEIELDDTQPFGSGGYYAVPQDKKCTCGSSSVGSDRHSDWCDRSSK